MNSADAEALGILMLQLNSKMNDSVWFVQEKGTPEELSGYRRQAAEVMSALLDIVNTIYEQHPHLRPQDLGGPCPVNPGIFKDRFYVPVSDDQP